MPAHLRDFCRHTAPYAKQHTLQAVRHTTMLLLLGALAAMILLPRLLLGCWAAIAAAATML